MRPDRLFGLLPRKTEISEHEIKRWEEALVRESFRENKVYTALLSPRNDLTKKTYASLIVEPYKTKIDIPLVEYTPEEDLLQQAYKTTFFGEAVPEEFRNFATEEFTMNKLLAFLNRKSAGVPATETQEWFYKTFDLKRLEGYGPIYIGSYGGQAEYGYYSNATIERRFPRGPIKDEAVIEAAKFAQTAQKSLPHLSVSPLSVDAYLQDVQSTLKFLPKDWEIS